MHSRLFLQSPKKGNYLEYVGKAAPWYRQFTGGHVFYNLMFNRRNLPIFLVLWNGRKMVDWVEIFRDNVEPGIMHLESFWNSREKRERHYLDCIKEAHRTGEPVIREIFGVSDLFIPMSDAATGFHAFLFAGHFLRDQPDEKSAADNWKEMTGGASVANNPDYTAYVRTLLQLPVLSAELLPLFVEIMGCYARVLSQKDPQNRARDRIVALHTEKITRLWPVYDRNEAAIHPDRFVLPIWFYEGRFSSWIREAMGMTHPPDTTMVLTPLSPSGEHDNPADALLKSARIRHFLLMHIQSMNNCSASPYRDVSVCILVAHKNGISADERRHSLENLARSLVQLVAERFATPCAIGVGGSRTPGAPLRDSLQEAATSLYVCIHRREQFVFHSDLQSIDTARFSDVHSALETLKQSISRTTTDSMRVAADLYVQAVLMYARSQLESVRVQFLLAVHLLFEQIKRDHPLRRSFQKSFFDTLAGNIERSLTVTQVIGGFTDACLALHQLTALKRDGSERMAIDALVNHIHDNYPQPLKLAWMAEQFGASIPVFLVAFKEATGQTFGVYLQSVRIEHSRELLTTTTLPLARIASSVGYRSAHQLIYSFKAVYQITPGEFRDANTPTDM